jgi:hypothetical protein
VNFPSAIAACGELKLDHLNSSEAWLKVVLTNIFEGAGLPVSLRVVEEIISELGD